MNQIANSQCHTRKKYDIKHKTNGNLAGMLKNEEGLPLDGVGRVHIDVIQKNTGVTGTPYSLD